MFNYPAKIEREKYVLSLDWCCNAKPSTQNITVFLREANQQLDGRKKIATLTGLQSARETSHHLTLMDNCHRL